MNKKEDAIKCFEKAINLKPDYLNAYISLGNTLNSIG